MSKWHPIKTAPKDGTCAILYFGTRNWTNMDGSPASFVPPNRLLSERSEFGYWNNGAWHQAGTGHDYLDPWCDLPTHWMPLPEMPQ